MSIDIGQRANSQDELFRRFGENIKNTLRVSIPGIIASFDSVTQTATVQVAIREQVSDNQLNPEWLDIPLLLDVPIVLPRAGNFAITMPVQQGDECLIIFADMCIDAWFSSGGVQNQLEKRRHDLSDAFAVMGCWSQPNKLPYYSTNTVQIRNESGSSYIELTDSGINLVAPVLRINGHVYNNHTHSAPSGGGTTSGVL